ncbi:MAG: hypothetical protein GY725_24755 [bacterium]|nr:hypothetical protein [bacterium]
MSSLGCVTDTAQEPGLPSDGAEVRVLALDCEIGIPAYYTVQTQDVDSVSFFSSRLDEVGRIRIDNDPDDPEENPRFRVLNTREVAHLKISEIEYLGFEGRRAAPAYVSIRSKDQRLTLLGDATRLSEDLVQQCAESVSEADMNVHRRRQEGCAYELQLRPEYSSVFESAQVAAYSTSDDRQGWQLSDVDPDGPLGREGVADGDRITHFCGLPFSEYVVSGGQLCCETGDPESLTLTVERSAAESFDVRIPKPAP